MKYELAQRWLVVERGCSVHYEALALIYQYFLMFKMLQDDKALQ